MYFSGGPPLWHASAAIQTRQRNGALRPKPYADLTRRERTAVAEALRWALEGVGDHTQTHEEMANPRAAARQRRHPMTEEEAAGVETVRRLRRAGLVAG